MLTREDNSESDPKACLKVLNAFKKNYSLGVADELWLVCDVDRWGERKLSEVHRLCRQKKYLTAVSNPCFESWLLLHLVRLDKYSQEEKQKLVSCKMVKGFLKLELGGSYNKTNLNIDKFADGVEDAIKEAKRIDIPEHDWPIEFGSKVFNLVESMIP